MYKTVAGALLLAVTASVTPIAAAGVYMCVDPATGKKTFTDRACPATKEPGKKVRVESQTRPHHHGLKRDPVWNSDRNRSVSGRANLSADERVAASVSGNGLLGVDS
jgi:hypothetical protein